MSIGPNRVYKPRYPRESKFYSVLSSYFKAFLNDYDARFQAQYGYLRPVVSEAIYKYLDCGNLTKGFARVRCGSCGEEYLVSFSCKMRYFCPSCHQKRVLILGEFLKEQILSPTAHRQIVFTIPRMLRCYFMYERRLLGKLSQCGYATIKEIYQAALKRDNAFPGVVMSIQTFGDLVNFHPHLHALVTEGCFNEKGEFFSVPRISPMAIQKLFCHKVLKMLLEEGKITKKTIELIMSWRHSGFNVDSHVYIDANNTKGLEGLVQYIVRAPLSQGKILAAKDKVVYRSKINPRIKSNFRIYDPLDWIAAVTSHIPDKGQQMVRYYGYYSNVKRGRHRKNGITPEYLNIKEPILSSKEYRRRWQDLIKKVYETDPLICPKCGGKMNIISFVKEKLIIDRILTHKGLPQVYSHSPPEEKKVSTELIRVACYD
jgi:Zn finger protein HypA/HybF involved in hydrogenase expression